MTTYCFCLIYTTPQLFAVIYSTIIFLIAAYVGLFCVCSMLCAICWTLICEDQLLVHQNMFNRSPKNRGGARRPDLYLMFHACTNRICLVWSVCLSFRSCYADMLHDHDRVSAGKLLHENLCYKYFSTFLVTIRNPHLMEMCPMVFAWGVWKNRNCISPPQTECSHIWHPLSLSEWEVLPGHPGSCGQSEGSWWEGHHPGHWDRNRPPVHDGPHSWSRLLLCCGGTHTVKKKLLDIYRTGVILYSTDLTLN